MYNNAEGFLRGGDIRSDPKRYRMTRVSVRCQKLLEIYALPVRMRVRNFIRSRAQLPNVD